VVGDVRIALILVAACASEPVRATAPAPVANHTALGDVQWPSAPRLPYVALSSSIDDDLASQVVMRLGPVLGPPLDPASADRLRAQLPSLRGTQRLAALDRVADAAELGADEGFDEAAVLRKLEHVAKAYADVIAEPGFAKYANADQVLFRAAHVHFEMLDYDGGAPLVLRLLEHYPKSAWLADADVLLGDAEVDRDPAVARHYYDDAIASARPAIVKYARYGRLHALDVLAEYRTELDDGEQLARSSETYREPATRYVIQAYAEVGDPDEARARFDAIDPAHLPTLLRLLSDQYRRLGKYDDATAILDEILATSSDNFELCAVHERALELAIEINVNTTILNAARSLVEAARRANDPRCSILADQRVGETAWNWQFQLVGKTAVLQDDEMWRYALAIVSTPERKAVELRDHAYLLWELAVRTHTATAWYSAATALDAAFLATQDQTLSAGAELARSNARVLAARM
jgi:tetratricopeptide (TPR) repeat protein